MREGRGEREREREIEREREREGQREREREKERERGVSSLNIFSTIELLEDAFVASINIYCANERKIKQSDTRQTRYKRQRLESDAAD